MHGRIHPFLEAIAKRPVLFDGAIGTELYRRGVFLNSNFEELNIKRPSLVLEVHRDYARAGAQVLTTNTYGAGVYRLARFHLEDQVHAINRAAAELARRAGEDGVWVAGSVGPSGLEPAAFLGPRAGEVENAFAAQITGLVAGGVDLLLLETFGQLSEMQIALRVARRLSQGRPVVTTMRFESDEKLADGSIPEDVASALATWGADVIGVNCGEGPGLVFRVARKMIGKGRPVLAQPNAGTPEKLEGRTIYVGNPEFFGVYGRRMLKAGVSAVGGCCGTTPDHIQRMRGAVRMMGGAVTVRDVPEDQISPRQERPAVAERSGLAAKMAAGEFVVSVEVNPPMGLDASRSVAAAAMLQKSGLVDVINISDGPRASVRMSNLALAVKVQQELGMEVILHVCCRDRNLLALQADLLGAHALGVRNLVVITGDPPKVGDYPDATAVYDLDSVGLLRWVDGYNHGVDPAGKEMQPTHFHVATGAEPGALDYDREIRRLEEKAAAGADFVMTQPVYDPQAIDRFLDDIAHIELPVLLGLLPLASARNAEFLHAEVPGMTIPEETRDRMREAGSGPAARAVGVAIAREALLAARDRIQGAYIMPPLGRYEMAPAILEVLGDSAGRAARDAGGTG